MKHRILQAGRLLPSLEARLAAEFDTHLLASEADPQAFLAAHGGEFEGFVTSAGVGFNAATLELMPKLRVVSSFGVGLDKLDLAAAKARGIAVGYTPDVLNDCVADLAMVLMLDVARRVSEADRYVRRGGWTTPGVASYPLARKVSGAKLGIVGLGRIGQTIAKRAGGFEMDIRYHSRRPVEGAPWRHEPSLIELARWCDFLIVITAGGAGTKHLINAEVLDALGPRGFIVNVARGSVIDEAALVRALLDQRIAGAGLDVFENEPQVPTELFTLDNVVLLPHIASGTQETRQAMADRTYDNLQGFLRDGRMVSPAPLPN
ncbi:2-hydroxyacid dehydrogenase [Piscinibacter sp.]|uniref:2-hydroxyacid dehydrogenase n=1 Tax=Piscinibacter sp. TaxID=1903157 RepID=UPI001B3DC4A4|nr:2-hydroxyacid dehydrogenase [Piscinibacter sp.]MBK7529463.1 2-hydroxyacid dehydrogenase [Piscinibacter sp.]MBP6543746.1 2-hydroxyacid dehydrogenase [Piscinibacter sp.]